MSTRIPALPSWSDLRGNGEPSPPAPDVVHRLALEDRLADARGDWSGKIGVMLREIQALRWSVPEAFGGEAINRSEMVVRSALVAEGSLTAAFILSQHDAAVRRLAAAQESGRTVAEQWLRRIAHEDRLATVGISQLTTSKRHGDRALRAVEQPGSGYLLEGAMPWVTAASHATVLVTGAVLDDGRQILVAVPSDRPGLVVQEPFPLAALQASCTSEVRCTGVLVKPEEVLVGPSKEVMKAPGQVGTGGLETSALALGQARAALVAMESLCDQRDDLHEPFKVLTATWVELAKLLLAAAQGSPAALSSAEIRARANALVLASTQAFLTARKGTGFVRGEPAQRWARQALFFLVWSCPTPVAQSALRDLAGFCSA